MGERAGLLFMSCLFEREASDLQIQAGFLPRDTLAKYPEHAIFYFFLGVFRTIHALLRRLFTACIRMSMFRFPLAVEDPNACYKQPARQHLQTECIDPEPVC